MIINFKKLDLVLAEKCMCGANLCTKAMISSATLTRAKKGSNVRTSTIGRIARVLGVRPIDIVYNDGGEEAGK